jgi:hypothetical protein
MKPLSITSLLEKHGERFLARFDEPSSSKSLPKPPADKPKQKKASTNFNPTQNKSEKKKDSQTSHASAPDMTGHVTGRKCGSSALDEIEALMQWRGSEMNAVPSTTHIEARHTASHVIDNKAERRAFMSHRADKVHSKPPQGQEGSNRALVGLDKEIDASQLSPEEFRKLQLEVEKLGGRALDKKQGKVWKAAFLDRLGAKSDKLPRMSAKIGGGIAKKRKEKEARDRALKIESGDLRLKGQGAKKRKERSANYDRGLQEAGPGFKNGVLRVKANN